MAKIDPKGGDAVTITNWDACYNSGDNEIVLSCTVSAKDPSAGITGVGLVLNNSQGQTVASSYTELSSGCESVTPAINLAPGALKVGAKIMGVVTGEVDGQHYFFEKYLIIGKC